MEQKIEEKLEIEKEIKSRLMVYLFILHPIDIQIKNERSLLVLGYDLEGAMVRAIQLAEGLGVAYTGQKIPITEFLSKLQLDGVVLPPTPEIIKEIIPEISKEKMGLETFKESLILAKEELVKDEKDKKIIEEIIKKL